MSLVSPVTALPARNAAGLAQLTQPRARLAVTALEPGTTAVLTVLRREEGGDWVRTPVVLRVPSPAGDDSAALNFDVDGPQGSPHYSVMTDGNAARLRVYLADLAPASAALAALSAASGDFAAAGTPAAGSTGKAADAGHVHPITPWTPQALSGAGAATLVQTTKLTSSGAGQVVTLADGTRAGQRKTLVAVSGHGGGNTSVITPATPNGYTTITLEAVREYAELEWSGTAWDILHTTGTIA